MDAKKSNKIRDIVRLQQILKKWRKTANASKNNNNTNNNNNHSIVRSNSNSINGGGNKGIKFLKKTLSFSDHSVSSSPTTTTEHVPKGYLAVCVGKQFKRYVIPTEYLGHQAFGILLREAEEEFGFHQEGVLKIPCDIAVFERILKMVQNNRDDDDNGGFYIHDNNLGGVGSFEFHDIDVMSSSCCSPDSGHILQPSIPQLCR